LQTYWAFDLDGVLIDTREAVRLAYRAAGVDMPDDAWGRPAFEWLPDLCGKAAGRVHVRKNEYYPALLAEHGEVLEMALRARLLVETGQPTGVLTGASSEATEAALALLRLRLGFEMPIIRTSCSRQDKIDTLAGLAVRYPQGVYVDDQDGVTVPDGWRFEKWTQ
jgi:beta-phosphoglucomutase-like phosphatase (HAD superfamily)